MENIVKIVNELSPNNKINVIDISKTFNFNTYTKYTENILNKLNVMLFVKKTNANQFVFDLQNVSSTNLLYFTDTWISFSDNIDPTTLKILINRLIFESKDLKCNICFETCFDIDKNLTSCHFCGNSICNKCLFKMAKINNTCVEKINENKFHIIDICPICKQKGFNYTISRK